MRARHSFSRILMDSGRRYTACAIHGAGRRRERGKVRRKNGGNAPHPCSLEGEVASVRRRGNRPRERKKRESARRRTARRRGSCGSWRSWRNCVAPEQMKTQRRDTRSTKEKDKAATSARKTPGYGIPRGRAREKARGHQAAPA